MKNAFVLALATAFFACALTENAQAIPVFAKMFAEKYGDNEDLAAAAKEAKCNVCHYGKSKKNRNDYGMALSEILDKDNYKSTRVKEEEEAVKKEIFDAFVEVEGKDAKAGGTFGELLKAGKLPGTAPEGEE
jgi:hypothetical protein